MTEVVVTSEIAIRVGEDTLIVSRADALKLHTALGMALGLTIGFGIPQPAPAPGPGIVFRQPGQVVPQWNPHIPPNVVPYRANEILCDQGSWPVARGIDERADEQASTNARFRAMLDGQGVSLGLNLCAEN